MDYKTDGVHSRNWERRDYPNLKECNLKGSNFCDLSEPDCLITEMSLNQKDHDMYDAESTPVRACDSFLNRIDRDYMEKEPVEPMGTTSLSKRRRMLQFDNQVEEPSVFIGGHSAAVFNSNVRVNLFDDILPEGSQLISGFSDNMSDSSFAGDLDLSSEEWLSECFNDAEMQFIPENMDFTNAPEFPIDISDILNVSPETKTKLVPQRPPRSSSNVIIKGKKTLEHTPSNLPSSVVYPFTFIKPCGVHGEITLKDINQKIHTPPPSKLKVIRQEPPVYQMSAFSGKPVVGKTKIRTEGGKGSITIMRTKG